MEIYSLTDIGKTRTENQDNYWSAILNIDGVETGIVCMCDGMGGLNNGGLASKLVVESVRDSVLSGLDYNSLYNVMQQMNTTIRNLSEPGSLMGTTCTILCCCNNRYKVFHIGDSRCYKVSQGVVKLVSKDHSVVKEYNISKEENPDLYNKYRSKLTRCIGVKEEAVIDTYTGTYTKGDYFLLSSDGFWHSFEEKGYQLNLGNLQEAVQECINNGETDNITVSILTI